MLTPPISDFQTSPAAAHNEGVPEPKVTVVIPSHNRAKLLEATLRSVVASPLVASPRQIIVVDDDSLDATEDVARLHHVRYMRVDYHSISRSRNAGLALAETTYVTFLDDDDAWLPGNMVPQLAALEGNPAAAFAYGIAQCATEDLEPLPWTFPSPPLVTGFAPDRLHVGYPNVGVVLFRRDAVEEAGGFDPRIAWHQDSDLMIRLAARHDIVGIEVVGMLYRLRAPSKARADYYWKHRSTMNWSPKDVGVGWVAAARFEFKMRGLFYHRFSQDAAACLAVGDRRDALECVGRAVWASPARAVRHAGTLGSICWRCVSTQRRQAATVVH